MHSKWDQSEKLIKLETISSDYPQLLQNQQDGHMSQILNSGEEQTGRRVGEEEWSKEKEHEKE